MLNDKELEDIRRKLLELEEEPPVKAWANIQAEINPRRRWRFFWWLSSALLLLTAVSLFFFWDTLPLRTISPSATAHLPSINPRSKADEQSKIVEPSQAQQPVPTRTPQERSLPSEATQPESNIPTAEPGNTKSPESSEKENVPLLQPRSNITREKPIAEKNQPFISKLPEANSDKRNIKKDAPENELKEETQTEYKQSLETKSFPNNTLGNSRPAKPDETLTNHPTSHEKENNELVTENNKQVKTDSSQPNTILPANEQELLPQFSNSKPELSEKETAISKQVLSLDTLTKESSLDTVGVILEKDTASEEKERIIVTPPTNKGAKEWMVGLFFSPRYSFRIVTPSGSDNIYISGLNNRSKSGSDRMGYELGISISKAVTQHLYLESSLAFMQLKENLSYTYMTGEIDTLLRQGSSDGQQIQLTAVYATGQRQLISSYAYGGWRIGATYYFWQNYRRRFNVTMNGGINLLVKGQTKEIINGQETKTIYFPSPDNVLEQTNYNLLLGVGYSLRMMEKYELMLMPTLNYFLGSTFKSREPFGLQPYSLGIHVQLKRRQN